MMALGIEDKRITMKISKSDVILGLFSPSQYTIGHLIQFLMLLMKRIILQL